MNVAGNVNIRPWQLAARDLFTTSKREVPDFLNGQSIKVCHEAYKNTRAANPAKMAQQLGQVATEVRLKKGKRWARTPWKNAGRVVKEDSMAERILAKRMAITGSFGIRGDTMVERAKRLISARLASINFVRSGWLWPMDQLWSKVKGRIPVKSRIKQGARGRAKGYSIPAHGGKIDVRSVIGNTALNTEPVPPGTPGNPYPIAEAGLVKALAIATADMRAEFARRMNPHFKRVSAK